MFTFLFVPLKLNDKNSKRGERMGGGLYCSQLLFSRILLLSINCNHFFFVFKNKKARQSIWPVCICSQGAAEQRSG